MKRLILVGSIGLVLSGLFGSCKKDSFDTPEQILGTVQKGPFITGTSVTVQPLDDRLNPVGTSYQTQITDDKGNFLLNGKVSAPYVELIAHGYYFNEVAGTLSKSELTLRSISKPSDQGNNINILTTLAAPRIRKLLIEDRKSFSEAQAVAQTEVLAVFGIALQRSVLADRLDISADSEENAALLAVSAIMQDSRSEAELSELIAGISNDICQNGRLTNSLLQEKLRESGIQINPDDIRQNLIDRYAELGMPNAAVPDFYDLVDSDGDGKLNGADPYLILSEDRIAIGNEGGEVVLKVRSNQEWEATIEDKTASWLRLVRSSTETGQLTIVIDPNQGSLREAVIAVKNKGGKIIRYVQLVQDGTRISMQVQLVPGSMMSSEELLAELDNIVLLGFDKEGKLLFNHAVGRLTEMTLSVEFVLPKEQLTHAIDMNLYAVANDFDTYQNFRGTEEELKAIRSQQNVNRLETSQPRIGMLNYTLIRGKSHVVQMSMKYAVAEVQVRIAFDKEVFETEPDVLDVTFVGINDRNGYLFPVSTPDETDSAYRYDYTVGVEPDHRYTLHVYGETKMDAIRIRMQYDGAEHVYEVLVEENMMNGKTFEAGHLYQYTIQVNKKND